MTSMKLAAIALAAAAAGPAAPPPSEGSDEPELIMPAQCMRGVCVVPIEFLADMMKAHNIQVLEIRRLQREVGRQCGKAET